MNEAVISKIRKLLALTTSDNPHEAANATSAARRLMLKHGVEAAAVGETKPDIVDKVAHSQNKRVATWQLIIAETAAHACLCKILFASGCGTGKIWFVGRPVNIVGAEALHSYLLHSLEWHVRTKCAGEGVSFRTSYRLGWIKAVSDRLADEATVDAPAERSLVVTEDSEISDYLMQFGKPKGRNIADIDCDAAGRGYAHGKLVGLHRQLVGGGLALLPKGGEV